MRRTPWSTTGTRAAARPSRCPPRTATGSSPRTRPSWHCRYAPRAALANLAKLRANFDAYGPGGFYDAVAVRSGKVAKTYLSLDQGMIMAALGNVLGHDDMHRDFAAGDAQRRLAPVLRLEHWDLVPPSAAARTALGIG